MQTFTYILILCIFSIDGLSEQFDLLPPETTYFSDLAAIILLVAIFTSLVKRRRVDIDGVSLTILCFLIATFVASAVINIVSPSVLIAGLRSHFKFLPFLFLPFVYEFSAEQIKRQMYLLLGLTVMQIPVALYQRFITYAGVRSGDGVGGTLGPHSSGILSVWLACAICVILASHLNGLLKKSTSIVLIAAVAVPMMINETKISFFIIPLALIFPVMFWPKNRGKIGQMSLTIGLAIAFLGVLI